MTANTDELVHGIVLTPASRDIDALFVPKGSVGTNMAEILRCPVLAWMTVRIDSGHLFLNPGQWVMGMVAWRENPQLIYIFADEITSKYRFVGYDVPNNGSISYNVPRNKGI